MKLFLLALTLFVYSNTPGDESESHLSLKVKSEANPKGQYYIRLTHVQSGEKKEILKVVDVNSSNQYVSFGPIPKGNYTVAIFHDVNGNGKLDKNYLGVPTEPYGFSNNARGMFGPPSEKEQLFVVDKETIHELYLE